MVTTFHERCLLDAPVEVVNFALEGDLAIRKQHGFTWPFLTGDEGVAWAELDGTVVAVQVWSRKNRGRVWVKDVSYVLPEHRKSGYLEEVRQEVERAARDDDRVQFIEYLISTDNENMLRSLARRGTQPANYHYRVKVQR